MMSRLMTVREQLILVGLGMALLVGAGTMVWLREEPGDTAFVVPESEPSTPVAAVHMKPAEPVIVDAAPALDEAPTQPPPSDLGVAVMGAVARPGYYELSPDSRVGDLIRAARGAVEESDTTALNLAARLIDGTTLTIPFRTGQDADGLWQPGAEVNPSPYLLRAQWHRPAVSMTDGTPTSSVASTVTFGGGGIDLNTASQAELESLPGIGPALAQRIIAYRQARPFASVNDLDNVSGIGPKRLEAVRDLVTVGP